MFGKPAYNYNSYTSYQGSPGINSVSIQDINQEINQTMLNTVYNQINPINSNNENSVYSTKNHNSNVSVPGNGIPTDQNTNFPFGHAIGNLKPT